LSTYKLDVVAVVVVVVVVVVVAGRKETNKASDGIC